MEGQRAGSANFLDGDAPRSPGRGPGGDRGQSCDSGHIPSSTLDNEGLDYDASEAGNQIETSDNRMIYHDKKRETTYYVYPAYEKVLVVSKDGTRRWLGALEDQPAA